jgi:hypothetical protein
MLLSLGRPSLQAADFLFPVFFGYYDGCPEFGRFACPTPQIVF